jgi:hypothetical protein
MRPLPHEAQLRGEDRPAAGVIPNVHRVTAADHRLGEPHHLSWTFPRAPQGAEHSSVEVPRHQHAGPPPCAVDPMPRVHGRRAHGVQSRRRPRATDGAQTDPEDAARLRCPLTRGQFLDA